MLNLLLREVTHRITDGQEPIPDVPSVKDFAYEEKYFKQFVGGSVSLVGRNETAGVIDQEVIDTKFGSWIVKFTYLVIDGVGCLRVNGSNALVFVQVSHSKYAEHSTRSYHLKKSAPENPVVSLSTKSSPRCIKNYISCTFTKQRTGTNSSKRQKERRREKTARKMKTGGIITRSMHAEQVGHSLQVEYLEHQFF